MLRQISDQTSLLLCHLKWVTTFAFISGNLAPSMQMVESLQVEDEVTQCCRVHKLNRSLRLLLFFLATILLHHDAIELNQVEEDCELVVPARAFNLHSLKGSQRYLPLEGLELSHCTVLVRELCFTVDHELLREHEESSLAHEELVTLDNESVALVAVHCHQIAIPFEQALPVDR